MLPPARISQLTLAFALLGVGYAFAQAQDTKTGELTPAKKHRPFSNDVAQALAAGMPKYDPPKPVEPKAEEDDVDLREVDKPRNQIIRLPEYVVREEKPPVFRERDINTKKGLGELAKFRYLSESTQALNRYTIPLVGMSAEAYALMLYAEDERLQNMDDLKEASRDTGLVDKENAKEIKKAARDTYGREFDYTYRHRD